MRKQIEKRAEVRVAEKTTRATRKQIEKRAGVSELPNERLARSVSRLRNGKRLASCQDTENNNCERNPVGRAGLAGGSRATGCVRIEDVVGGRVLVVS